MDNSGIGASCCQHGWLLLLSRACIMGSAQDPAGSEDNKANSAGRDHGKMEVLVCITRCTAWLVYTGILLGVSKFTVRCCWLNV